MPVGQGFDMDEKQIENLRRLAKSSVSEDGQVRPFAEQLADYAFGSMPESEVFVVSPSSAQFSLPLTGDYPLVLTIRNAKKIVDDHDIPLKQLLDLPQWLKLHPLAVDSMSIAGALVIVADAKDVNGKDIVIALHIEKERGQRAHEIFVDEITSVYGKNNLSFFLKNTASAGLNIYVNERTRSWLVRTGVQFPALEVSSIINEYTLERIESQEQFDSVTTSKESARAPESYKGLWWSPGERIAFYADPTGEKEPQTWQGVDAERLSAALAGEASPALVAQALGAPDYDGRPLSALKRVNDWESMPESHDELAEWKERVEERIDLSATQPEQDLSTEKTAHLEEKKLLTAEKKTLGEKVSGLFNRDKQTARQDESRAHSQARGDDGKRPTRAAEKDL